MIQKYCRTNHFVSVALLVIVNIFTTVTAAANSTRSSIANGVEYWMSQPNLPVLSSPLNLPTPSTLKLQKEMQLAFHILHNKLFGNRGPTFHVLPSDGDVAFIHLETRTLFINPKIVAGLINIVPKVELNSILILVLAHEIGHYFYETQVQYSYQGTSFLNHPSYAYSPYLSSESKAQMHGEVDAIGIYLASKVGVDPLLGLKTLRYVNEAILKHTHNLISLSQIEIDGRLEVIKAYLSHTK